MCVCVCVCVCNAHRCSSNWFHGEDARDDGRAAWKADKEKRPYIIIIFYIIPFRYIPSILYPRVPTIRLVCTGTAGTHSCEPDDGI